MARIFLIVFLCIAVFAMLVIFRSSLKHALILLLSWIHNHRLVGSLVYITIFGFGTSLLVPATFLTLGILIYV